MQYQVRCGHDILRHNGSQMKQFYAELLNVFQNLDVSAQAVVNATLNIAHVGASKNISLQKGSDFIKGMCGDP